MNQKRRRPSSTAQRDSTAPQTSGEGVSGQKGAGSKPGGVGGGEDKKPASSIASEKKAVPKPVVQDTSQSKSKKSFGEFRPLSVQH